MKLLVTGGAGFIGSNFIRHILRTHPDYKIINLDKLTYAGNLDNLKNVAKNPNYQFVKGDILDEALVDELVGKVDAVIHFAAESHVTRSENEAEVFYKTNVEGTRVLLDAAVKDGGKRFVHISTDEIYGSKEDGFFKEEDKEPGDHQASSVYSKSKALADDLALSYKDKLDVVVVRPTNNFGQYQYPEKALPRWTTRVLENEPIPVWGDGHQVRDWLYAVDTARAVDIILEKGISGEAYNVASNNDPEIENIELANIICEILGVSREQFIKLVPDPRPNHDFRYAIDTTKIKALGWQPEKDIRNIIKNIIVWYKENKWWWEPIKKEAEKIYSDI